MTHHVKEHTTTEEREHEKPVNTADIVEEFSRKSKGSPANPPAEIAPLLSTDRTADFQARWDSIQTSFVDEPRRSVEQADSLVAEIMQELAKTFADERQKLESQWGRGDNVSTEELRVALQRYRSFFSRLLSV